MINRVCSSCFADNDLRRWIRDQNGKRGCDACGRFDSPTCNIEDICERIQGGLERYWGFAVDQLPYESAEGGYQGATWSTWEILVDEVGLELPRDRRDRLLYAVISHLRDEVWCEYDWLTLDADEALKLGWNRFCDVVKHKKRFFFHNEGIDDRDSYSPKSLLKAIASSCEDLGLMGQIPVGTVLWRARSDLRKGIRHFAEDFGPPPLSHALQSNRMNPPGIPMLYLASDVPTALKETRAKAGHVGRWKLLQPLCILDLRSLPDVPGIFSDNGRSERLTLRFLHQFADDIVQPVARDQRTHIEYLPSQVVTEYLRDYKFKSSRIDGIAYASTVNPRGWNLALFSSRLELGLVAPAWYEQQVKQIAEFAGSKAAKI